jgi:DNA-binding PadR family transcriptional regulator
MLDKIILGVLGLKEMTVYDIKKALDRSINHFYTTSYGSIHPALVKLERLGLVVSTEQVSGGRAKKRYAPTGKGREVFQKWLRSDMHVSRMREDSLVRIFFFGLLDADDRRRILAGYLQEIESAIDALKRLKEEVARRAVPHGLEEVARFQTETLRFGIDEGRFVRDWYAEMLEKRIETEERT